MVLDIGTLLRYYKQKDIQEAMVASCQDREVAIKFGDKGFGKRPDTLGYPNDVLEFAKQGSTSFHVSEEHWSNVYGLTPALKRQEVDNLRIGWDLILDIDSKQWKLSKLITHFFVQSLKDNNIQSISVKFSGNKGFHIGVPFEAFPQAVNGKPISKLFPEGPQAVAKYLLNHLLTNYVYVKEGKLLFGDNDSFDLKELQNELGKEEGELSLKRCKSCHKKWEGQEATAEAEYICPKCEFRQKDNSDLQYKTCERCNTIMNKYELQSKGCSCGSTEWYEEFNVEDIIELDTLLISTRHLYRMPYSLHEKSGLASIPIDPEKVLEFDRESAHPAKVKVSEFTFLDTKNTKQDEAKELLMTALDFEGEKRRKEEEKDLLKQKTYTSTKDFSNFDDVQQAIPEEFFPPCMKAMLEGMEDGRKRSMFIISNFLESVGWDYDAIEAKLHEWNKKNKEPLRDVLIQGQVKYRRQQKSKVLPPNCDNKAYYVDLQFCKPDNLCRRIKNPVQYSKRKTFALRQEEKKKKE